MDSKDQCQFLDFTRRSRTSDVPRTSFESQESKPRANDLAQYRPLAYALLASAFIFFIVIALAMGWLP